MLDKVLVPVETAHGHLMILDQTAAHSISVYIVKWKIIKNSGENSRGNLPNVNNGFGHT